ncbi:hypothetical protein L1049_027793 [Liquidambar formosana]|uniref:AB hydrolase-1 domain-containing protein n=1 Tax=Liquidambar formosana TaxID=63359 RepID=A0AAP0WVI6_LIQFO
MSLLQSDLRSGIHIAASAFCSFNPIQSNSRFESSRVSTARGPPPWVGSPAARVVTAFNGAASAAVEKRPEKPSICTADELHYVPQRNHPLLLLSGVATNAIGYDLSPGSSFARYMSSQGFDTWILEVRGAGLTTQGADSREIKQSINAMSEQLDSATRHGTKSVFSTESHSMMNSDAHADSRISSSKGKMTTMVTKSDELQLVTKLTETFMHLSEKLSGFLNEGLWEARENSGFASQIRDLSQRLVNIIGGGQQSISPHLFDLQERFSTTIEDFQKQLDLIVKYDWDFDHYLEEDVPTAMEYVRTQCKPKDGKLLAIGHSMGGILLYAMLSRHGFDGRDSGLASIVTLGSSLDYTSSKSSLKLLLPLGHCLQLLILLHLVLHMFCLG